MRIFRKLGELIRFCLIHFRSIKYYESRNEKLHAEKGIVVSFTSTPIRIQHIAATIKSLLDQTIRPERIVLTLPRDLFTENSLPSFLKKCHSIEILWIPKDMGPAKKLLPVLRESVNQDLIVVVDDDHVYPKRLIENYLYWSDKLPDSALGMLGWKVPRDLKHASRKLIIGAAVRIFDFKSVIQKPEHVDVMQGGSSYAVKRSFFSVEVFKIPKKAFYVDDIWINGQLAKNRIDRLVIPAQFEYTRINALGIPSKSGLVKTHNRDNKNNDQLYDHFKKFWIYE